MFALIPHGQCPPPPTPHQYTQEKTDMKPIYSLLVLVLYIIMHCPKKPLNIGLMWSRFQRVEDSVYRICWALSTHRQRNKVLITDMKWNCGCDMTCTSDLFSKCQSLFTFIMKESAMYSSLFDLGFGFIHGRDVDCLVQHVIVRKEYSQDVQ